MTDKKRSFILFYDYAELFREMTDKETGQLFKAIFAFLVDGESRCDKLSKMQRMAYNTILSQILRDQEKYAEKCATNKRVADEREAKRKRQKEIIDQLEEKAFREAAEKRVSEKYKDADKGSLPFN